MQWRGPSRQCHLSLDRSPEVVTELLVLAPSLHSASFFSTFHPFLSLILLSFLFFFLLLYLTPPCTVQHFRVFRGHLAHSTCWQRDLSAPIQQQMMKWASWGLEGINDPSKGTELGKILARTQGQIMWIQVPFFASTRLPEHSEHHWWAKGDLTLTLLEPSFLPRFTFIRSFSLPLSLTDGVT